MWSCSDFSLLSRSPKRFTFISHLRILVLQRLKFLRRVASRALVNLVSIGNFVGLFE